MFGEILYLNLVQVVTGKNLNESVIFVTIQKSPSRLSKLFSKSENKHSRDFVQIENEVSPPGIEPGTFRSSV